MDNIARDTVPTDLWQQGEFAFLISYDFSGSHNHNHNASSQNYYLNLHNSINIGAWRFRNQLVYNYDSQRGKNNLSSVNSYIQRDIHKLKSQIVLGETFTNNDVFDSIKFIVASIISDDLMLPIIQRDFAPVIRGIAQTNACVTVRQNNYIIYENYVPPGPFVITDLYAIYGSGNLHVTVTEDNGKQTKFIQPFSSVPIMQREGKLKYQFTLGRYANSKSNFYKPYFSELASIYGVFNRLSLLSGIQAVENYLSLSLGLGLGLDDFGAFFLM
ncbi:fimbria/pilus outer membrane usher protein [Arsenophonus endosymbiont of Aleurodicus floccissimus]|uniref:fimbria/pilus outer membrane usher protein n=1 Tax=Arsenophonus endosymbiont of Aleurodicus floccissimus TaxID=2152761 RepID=UPI002105C353|nr:fimbria/pilus outer membrane usher protein [Arsenophonus endosymbiont of Aleurodicus floccissimus]